MVAVYTICMLCCCRVCPVRTESECLCRAVLLLVILQYYSVIEQTHTCERGVQFAHLQSNDSQRHKTMHTLHTFIAAWLTNQYSSHSFRTMTQNAIYSLHIFRVMTHNVTKQCTSCTPLQHCDSQIYVHTVRTALYRRLTNQYSSHSFRAMTHKAMYNSHTFTAMWLTNLYTVRTALQ